MASRRASRAELLAHALGFTTKRGSKHGKVFDATGRLIAVYPLTRGREHGSQLANYRAALLWHANRKDL